MSPLVRELPGVRDLLPLAAAAPGRYPGLLQSSAPGGPLGRFDLLPAAAGPGLELRAGRLYRDGTAAEGGFLDALEADWRRLQRPRADDGLPFHGGWLLFLGYELALETAPGLALPPAPGSLPAALALRCPGAIVVDHVGQRTVLVGEAGQAGLLAAMERDLAAAPPLAPVSWPRPALREEPADAFLQRVAAVQRDIAAGVLTQANVSRGWQAAPFPPASAAALHAALRRANPAPFAALLQQPGWALVSSSPERLLEIRGRTARTRPIAGTAPRGLGMADAAAIEGLLASRKERSEHRLLLDQACADLARVAEPGSVEVEDHMVLESHPHVHHLVSGVTARLRAGTGPAGALRAMFPGASITGCPKGPSMQRIGQLEGGGRGAYTGSLGYLDCSGDLDLNILIRSLVLEEGGLHFRTGAGIVAGSDPQRELAETRAKALGLLRALDPQAVP